MPTVNKSIEVNAPLDKVYDIWSNFERFPEFMEHVKEVRRTGPEKTHWVVETAGQTVEWDADTKVKEKQSIEWDAQGESSQNGRVTFDDLGENRTRVNVNIDYELGSNLQEKGAKWFGIDDSVVQNDLERFKDIVETGHTDVTEGTRV